MGFLESVTCSRTVQDKDKFIKWGIWGMINELAQGPQLARGRAKVQLQAVWAQCPHTVLQLILHGMVYSHFLCFGNCGKLLLLWFVLAKLMCVELHVYTCVWWIRWICAVYTYVCVWLLHWVEYLFFVQMKKSPHSPFKVFIMQTYLFSAFS